MTPDNNEEAIMKAEIDKLREKLNGFENSIGLKFADLEGTVRVVKHDVANLQLVMQGVGVRFDKLSDLMTASFTELRKDIANVNLKHEKGASFYTGMAVLATAAATAIGTLLMFIGKSLGIGTHP